MRGHRFINFLGNTSALGGLPLRAVSKTRLPVNVVAAAQSMSKSFHYNRSGQTLSQIGVRIANWYPPQGISGAESGTGSAISIQASIEYPIGAARQLLTFGGNNNPTLPDTTDAASDLLTLATPIPANAIFQIWIYRSGMTNMPYWNTRWNANPGDQMQYGASITNVCAGTSPFTSSTGAPGFGPCAIFSPVNTRAIAIAGDSRAWGTGDTPDVTADIGEIERTVGAVLPCLNICVPSSSTVAVLAAGSAGYGKRVALANAYCSSIVSNYGINDYGASQTAAQLMTNLATFLALFPKLKKFQTTNYVSSTGAWTLADGSDQTTATYNAQRVAGNALINGGGVAGIDGHFDSSSAVALGNSDAGGKWMANGTPGAWTADGLHATQLGTLAIKSLGAINPSLFG